MEGMRRGSKKEMLQCDRQYAHLLANGYDNGNLETFFSVRLKFDCPAPPCCRAPPMRGRKDSPEDDGRTDCAIARAAEVQSMSTAFLGLVQVEKGMPAKQTRIAFDVLE